MKNHEKLQAMQPESGVGALLTGGMHPLPSMALTFKTTKP